MATIAERSALLAVRCPWCGAAPGAECYTGPHKPPNGDRRAVVRRLITTLDGGCHDARWQAALGRGAVVIGRGA